MLARPVTVNFHEPAPLNQIVAYLADAVQCDVLIDRIALAAAQTSDRVEASLVAQKKPLGAALRELLRPLGLAFRAVDAQTLQITTPEALGERMELEFYPLDRWLAQGFSGPTLVERIKARVANDTWSDLGGAGEIYFDAPSGYILCSSRSRCRPPSDSCFPSRERPGGRHGKWPRMNTDKHR